MINTLSRMVMTAAAASLAFAPIAASANTRAANTAANYTTVAAPGQGVDAEGEELATPGIGLIVAIAAAIAVIGAVVIVAEEQDDDTQTNGAS